MGCTFPFSLFCNEATEDGVCVRVFELYRSAIEAEQVMRATIFTQSAKPLQAGHWL